MKQGSLFGPVQCDLQFAAHLRDCFSEVPPIFNNAKVERQDMGEFMQNCAEWHRLPTQPRKKKKKTLTGSYAGQNNLLATPLLQWYLSQGLEALDIQQVVEYSALSGAFNSLEKQCLMLVGKETEILPKLVWQVPSHCWGTLLMERPLPTLPGIPMCCTPMRKGPKHWSMTLFESSPH